LVFESLSERFSEGGVLVYVGGPPNWCGTRSA
jgi:hypothetical protein